MSDKPNNFTGLTPPGRVLISNPSGNIKTSEIDSSILDNIKGVHTDIQQQIDNIPISLLESSNIIENKISMMTDKISQYHNIISSNLENQKNALKMDEIPEGESHKLFKYGNYYNSLTVDGTAAAASYRIKGSVTISGAVQENYNTESIEIANELNSPAMKVVNNVSSNILSVNHGTSGENNRVTVLSNGNVGIGVSNPLEKLHVNGNIKVVGTINEVSQNDIENFKDITGNIQQQLDNIGLGISDLSLNVNDKFGENDSNTSNYVEQTRDKLFDKMTVMGTSVSNYVDATFDTFMTGKQNKITFGDGFSYDTSNNTLTVSTTNTLWNENVETNSISYGNVVVYGDRIEINDKEVATISVVNRKQNVITGAASTILTSDLPANKVLVTNTEGKVVASEVDTSKLNYLTNVTAPIQPQLDTISSQVTATSSEFIGLVNTSVSNASNYTAKIKSEFQGPVNDLYEPLTFGTGLVYDEATKTLSTDGTFVYQGTVTTSDSVWTSNEEYINYGEIKIYQDHIKVQDKQIATNVDFSAKQDKIVFPENIYNNENTISLAPSVWEDKGHYVRYKNTRVYNNRVTIGIDDTVDVKKYPPIGLPGITGSEQSGVIKTISGQTYGNGSYKIEWSSYSSGSLTPSLLFNGNQNESDGAHTGAFYNSNGEIIPYSGSSYHYLVSDYYGEWISLEFPERIYLTFIKLFPRRAYPYVSPKDYKIYGQNNDLTWDEILHETDAVYANNVHISEYCFPKKSYRKYGLVVNKVFSSGTILNFSEIEFFGTPDETLYVTTDDFANDTSDMLAWYKFDGANGETDSSGNDKTATVTGTPVPSESILSITKDNYLKLPDNIIDFDNDICISFWYRFDNYLITGRLFDFSVTTNIQSHANSIKITRNGISAMYFIIDTNLLSVDIGHVTNGDLIHLTWLIKKDGTWIIYKNGIQIYNVVHVYPATNIYTHSYLGKSNWLNEFNVDNQITLRDFRIYNRALTSEEVRVIYRAGRPVLYDFFADTSDMLAWYKFDGDFTDSSGNDKDLTGGTGTSFVDDSVIGTNSINFPDLNNQTLTSTVDLSGNKSFSISFWSYRNNNGENDWVLATPNSFSTNKNLHIGYRNTNVFTFEFYGNELVTTVQNDVNIWVNWTVTYNSINSKKELYKNGVLNKSGTLSGTTVFLPGIQLGYWNSYNFNGKLDDLRIYNRALTPDEIYTLYAKGNMISDGYAELHNIKADKLMPYNSSSINVGKHVNIRASVDSTESLSSRIVNSQTDVVETRENPYCMKLEKDLWMDGAGIIWTSDERIKKDITDIDDNVALQQILAIEPKTYKYIDNATKGDNTVYGFISQQIEDVIPEATKKTSRYIPNIYQSCEYNSSNNTIRIPADFDISRLNTLIADKFTSNYDEMSSNIVVTNENHLSTKLKIKDERNEDVVLQYSMTSNEDGYELQIHNRDFTHYASSSSSLSSNIFVYGTEINDLTTLDKSYIYTLNTCATQELSRKVDSLRLTNDTLSGYIDSLEYRINIIRDYISSNIS